jgi:RecA/RadA recombinase
MARKKSDADSTETETRLREAFAERRVDRGALRSSDAAAGDIGIRLPSLALRLLFQRTTLPLERTVVIYGPTASNKSSLLYYFYDLFRRNSGKYFHLDVEDKDTPVLRLSLTDYDAEAGDVRSCATLTEYQEEIRAYLNWFSGLCAKKEIKKVCPVVIGVDSLTAKMTAEAAAKVERDGGRTERRFADEARALADWFRVMPSDLRGLPICVMGVNHDKPKTDQHTGATLHQTPGGSAPNYNATYKIYAERVRKKKQDAAGWEGNRIRVAAHKNSTGGDGQAVEVEIVWRTRAVRSKSGGATVRQDTIWNWPKATVEHLYKIQGVDGGKRAGRRGAAVNDILGLRKATGGRYYSKPLGVPASDPVKPYHLGRELESRPELLEQLEPELGIHPSFAFQPGVDYDAQVADAIKNVGAITPEDEDPVDFGATEAAGDDESE